MPRDGVVLDYEQLLTCFCEELAALARQLYQTFAACSGFGAELLTLWLSVNLGSMGETLKTLGKPNNVSSSSIQVRAPYLVQWLRSRWLQVSTRETREAGKGWFAVQEHVRRLGAAHGQHLMAYGAGAAARLGPSALAFRAVRCAPARLHLLARMHFWCCGACNVFLNVLSMLRRVCVRGFCALRVVRRGSAEALCGCSSRHVCALAPWISNPCYCS